MPHDPTDNWDPIEGLPIFDLAAVNKPGQEELHFSVPKNLAELFRFVYGNLRYSQDDVKDIGVKVLLNIPLQPTAPVWLLAAAVYVIGVMDGIRMQMTQAELDRATVKEGKIQ
jgi:hypothetical protein